MTIDKSLRVKRGATRNRSVLTRVERIQRLREADRWKEGDSPLGSAQGPRSQAHDEEEEKEEGRRRRRNGRGRCRCCPGSRRETGCRCQARWRRKPLAAQERLVVPSRLVVKE